MQNATQTQNADKFAKLATHYTKKAADAIAKGDDVASEMYLHNAGKNMVKHRDAKGLPVSSR